jgi:hypothetical protein
MSVDKKVSNSEKVHPTPHGKYNSSYLLVVAIPAISIFHRNLSSPTSRSTQQQ